MPPYKFEFPASLFIKGGKKTGTLRKSQGSDLALCFFCADYRRGHISLVRFLSPEMITEGVRYIEW